MTRVLVVALVLVIKTGNGCHCSRVFDYCT